SILEPPQKNWLREKGLEPLHPKALDPKSSVSTNFTTLAGTSEIIATLPPRSQFKRAMRCRVQPDGCPVGLRPECTGNFQMLSILSGNLPVFLKQKRVFGL